MTPKWLPEVRSTLLVFSIKASLTKTGLSVGIKVTPLVPKLIYRKDFYDLHSI